MIESLTRSTKPRSLRQRHAAHFDIRWTVSSVAIVSARGDIDGTNAGTLTSYTVGKATPCRGLILDLSGLEFIGIDGFSALHRVSVSCARVGTRWVVVPSAAVHRLLRICNSVGSLPVVDTVDAALANFLLASRQEPVGNRQLIDGSRR
jgi:anti-anti-sigma factor